MGYGYKAEHGEFLPGITMPLQIHGLLRKRITEIGISSTASSCLNAQARAKGLVKALEALRTLPAQAIERLNILIEDTTLLAEPRQWNGYEKQLESAVGACC